MEFIYKYAALPNDKTLLKGINDAAFRMYEKIRRLDLNSLNISDYSKKYFGDHIRNLHSTLERYAHILVWAVADNNNNLSDFVLLDYGGGTGLLSLLAKEYNIGTVIYNDIYDVSCTDAREIGSAIENKADYYICGDIDETLRFLMENNIQCNSIASCDVIEHIYDIEGYIKKIKFLGNESTFNIVMSSNANPFNLFVRKSIEKIQIDFEHRNREYKYGHKRRDSLKSYANIRKEIIRGYAEDLEESDIKRLAKATRGMIEKDIKKAVDIFNQAKNIPKELDHRTNTCDPYTGNWAEHLMDPFYLKDLLIREGFKTDVLTGHYGRSSSFIKYVAGGLLNICIKNSGRHGIRLAPGYIIYGKRSFI